MPRVFLCAAFVTNRAEGDGLPPNVARLFFQTQQAYITSDRKMMFSQVVQLMLNRGAVRLVVPRTVVRLKVLLRAEEVSSAQHHVEDHVTGTVHSTSATATAATDAAAPAAGELGDSTVSTASQAPATSPGDDNVGGMLRVIRPHVLTFEAEFTSGGSWLQPDFLLATGWRLVDINGVCHPASFDSVTESMLKREDEYKASGASLDQ
jgi:hypothetical protein